MHIAHDDSSTAPPHRPAMIAQHKARITTAVARRLAKLIQYLLLYLLTALAVALNRHRRDCSLKPGFFTHAHCNKENMSYGVTQKAVVMMTQGMTKAQCDEIVGFSGETYKRYQYQAGSGLGAGGYFVKWKQGEAEISAQFDNGSLIMKFPDHLQ
jgi:hypothetical protein